MQKSTVLTAAVALTLFASMALSSCVTCERCARKRAAAAAAANAQQAPAPQPAAAPAAW